jgi:hypothetical protein
MFSSLGVEGRCEEETRKREKKKLYMDTNLTIWRLKREEDKMKTEMIRG